jgi:hypothetical protein
VVCAKIEVVASNRTGSSAKQMRFMFIHGLAENFAVKVEIRIKPAIKKADVLISKTQ